MTILPAWGQVRPVQNPVGAFNPQSAIAVSKGGDIQRRVLWKVNRTRSGYPFTGVQSLVAKPSATSITERKPATARHTSPTANPPTRNAPAPNKPIVGGDSLF